MHTWERMTLKKYSYIDWYSTWKYAEILFHRTKYSNFSKEIKMRVLMSSLIRVFVNQSSCKNLQTNSSKQIAFKNKTYTHTDILEEACMHTWEKMKLKKKGRVP
jgi:hypothetical protein